MCKFIAKRQNRLPNLSDFANLEELRIGARAGDNDSQSPHPFLRSVISPCLQRVIIEVCGKGTRGAQWASLDENLVILVGRHKTHRNLKLKISATTDPEEIRRLLPRAAQEGVLRVGFSERPDYCTP